MSPYHALVELVHNLCSIYSKQFKFSLLHIPSGSATRFCGSSGEWEPSNVRGCRSYEYIVIAGEVHTYDK